MNATATGTLNVNEPPRRRVPQRAGLEATLDGLLG